MSQFNFKSAICTNRQQSERLLSLGLKKETADMHWRLQPYYNDEGFDCGLEWSCNMGTFLQDDAYELFLDYIPAWSLHRLIEMMPEEIDRYFCTSFLTLSKHNVYYNESVDGAPDMEFEKNNLYDNLCDCISWLIKEGYFNKEYLEAKQ